MKYKLVSCVLILTLLICSSLVTLPLTSTGAASRIDYEAGMATLQTDPKTIYVDDDNVAGPWNGTRQHPYQNITDGLGHAATSDTIFVINGTYCEIEPLEIDKKILLQGENKDNTIIDGNGIGSVVSITENNVNISGFTIQNSGEESGDSGIRFYSNHYCYIENNIIKKCNLGIYLDRSSGNIFKDNIVQNNTCGVYIRDSNDNRIYHNRFVDNKKQTDVLRSKNVWDDGYPSGGNHWSNWTTPDDHFGPNQKQPGSDGIVDFSYVIQGADNVDHYPWRLAVHNVNTGLDYIWIQEAIDDTNTTDNHTISVEALMHYENVSVYKSLTLLPGGNLTTVIIDGNRTGRGLYINASKVVVSNFTILNCKYGVQLNEAGNTTLRNINMTNNTYNFFVDGTKLSHFINDIDNSSLVDGKRIYYLINKHDLVINSSTHPDLGYLGLINCTNMSVQNLNLSGNGQGLLLAYTNSSTIKHVNASKHAYGIYLFDCSGSTITDNDIINNEYGVCSLYSSSINITGNGVAGNQSCIYLFNSSNSEIVSNSLTSLSYGVELRNSDNSNIVGNHITSLDEGVYSDYSSGTNVTGNTITGTTTYGIELSWSNSSNVAGNTITGTTTCCGIELMWSNSSNVAGNTLINNNHGIELNHCFDNTIAVNNATDNTLGVWLFEGAHNNTLIGNDVMNNERGIYLLDSLLNNIIDNNIIGNLYEGVCLLNSSNNNVYDNNITRNNRGIYLEDGSKSDTILGNNIKENGCGIFLDVNSPSNNIIENSVINNTSGIRLKSSGNTIYHNSFIGTKPQAEVSNLYPNHWDDGWPSGGNYWSYCYYEYNDTIRPRIPMGSSDGIGDTHYTINENNVDNYPLMKPYGGKHDIGIETVICPFCGAPYRALDPPRNNVTCTYCGANFTIPPRLAGVIRSVYLSKTVFNTENKTYDPYIWIKVINYGLYDESGITITVQMHNATYNKTIKNEPFNLGYRNSRTFNCTWSTAGIAKGNYTITVSITPVTNEKYIEDNVYSCNVNVTILGDINGDFKVDIKDLVLVIKAFGKYKSHPNWNENHLIRNADVNNDDKVDIKDLVLVIKHYGEHYP